MGRKQEDPAKLEGQALDRWYRRTPDAVEQERLRGQQQEYDEFFGLTDQSNSWRDARLPLPPAPPVIRAPPVSPTVRPSIRPTTGARVGLPVDRVSQGAGPSERGFFEAYSTVPNPALGPAYLTDLPTPLNVVTPRFGGAYELGNGQIVRDAAEVERTYLEQKRRMSGKPETAPPTRVRSFNRLRDGFIPAASQLQKSERELDATCHPYGGWELDPNFPEYSETSQRYETQVTRARGLDYVVRNPGEKPVKFDGCAVWDPRRELLEAKGPNYAGLLERAAASKSEFMRGNIVRGLEGQASRQAGAARGRPVDWHVAEPGPAEQFDRIVSPFPGMRAQHTPAR